MIGSILLVFYLSHMLQAEGLGSYSTAMALFGLGELVCELGLSNFIPRELAKDLSNTNRYLIHTSVLVLASTSVTLIALVGLASHFGYSAETVISIYLISLALIPSALRMVTGAIFICHQRAEFEAFTTLFWTAVRILVSLYLLHQGYGVTGIVATFTVTSYLAFFNSLFFYIRYIGLPRWEFNLVFLRSMISEMRIFVALAIGGSIFTQAETIILSLVRGEIEVGFYSAAYKLITVWYLIPQSYMGVVFPIMTQAYQQSPTRSQAIQEKSIKYLQAVALPLTVGGFAAAEPIIKAFYGLGFEKAIIVFRIMAWHTVLAFINNVLWRSLLAAGEQRLAFRAQIISGLARVVLSFLFTPWLGSIGAAWALIGGYMIYTLMHVYYVQRVGIQLSYVRLSWRFAMAAAVMGIFTLAFAQQLNLFILVFLAALIYASSVFVLRAFSKEDLALFRQIWRQYPSDRALGHDGTTIEH